MYLAQTVISRFLCVDLQSKARNHSQNCMCWDRTYQTQFSQSHMEETCKCVNEYESAIASALDALCGKIISYFRKIAVPTTTDDNETDKMT